MEGKITPDLGGGRGESSKGLEAGTSLVSLWYKEATVAKKRVKIGQKDR